MNDTLSSLAETVVAFAPAKINLALRVGAPRQDGYHSLDTIFCALDLYDEVQAQLADSLSMEIVGLGTDLPTDQRNLVIQAAQLLQSYSGKTCGAKLKVIKRIPVAGGMAGGSADAAATLVALNELWQLNLDMVTLRNLGAQLGSDVPFALMGGLAQGTGRGETLRILLPESTLVTNGDKTVADKTYGFVLITNAQGLSTPAVFKKFDELITTSDTQLGEEPASTKELQKAIFLQDMSKISSAMINDLTASALLLRPDLQTIFQQISDLGYAQLLSGSGPTIGIFCDSAQVEEILAIVQERLPMCVCVAARGPALGAHLGNLTTNS